MLETLTIKNFAIIEDLEVNFKKGMNVLIGETGAGKSIIIDALSLLMGKRSSFDKIRNGEEKAFIEGSFIINNEFTLKYLKDQYEDLVEDDVLVVSRSLDINGKSVCKVNYHTVPSSILKDIMSLIIDIHSQHKDDSFFDEKKQIDYLDLYISSSKVSKKTFDALKEKYSSEYNEYISLKKELKRMEEEYSSLEDLDYLKYQYEELSAADIKENEIEDIEDELHKLSQFEKLIEAYQNFSGEYDEASSHLYNAKKALDSLKDDSLQEKIEKFNSLYYDIEDIYDSIKREFESLDNSQERIDYLMERKAKLSPLRRKYGRTTEEILSKFKEIGDTIALAENFDQKIEEQKKLIEKARNEALKTADEITEIRSTTKSLLENALNKELNYLALPNATFKVELTQDELSIKGIDKVIFKLQANKGSLFMPLKDTASLGETSRLNLAFKIIFNALNPVGTMVFDEIDTGISGAVGVAVAKKLHEIGQSSQCLVITHLPQVAAISDYQYWVSKKVINNTTKTEIKIMSNDNFIKALATMISGTEITENSMNAAKDLINTLKAE